MHVAQGDVAHQNGAVKKPGIVTEGLQIAQFAREIAVVGLAVIDPADQPDPGRARARRAEGVLLRLFKRSEEHTSELQSLMRTSYAVVCLNKKNKRCVEQDTTLNYGNVLP